MQNISHVAEIQTSCRGYFLTRPVYRHQIYILQNAQSTKLLLNVNKVGNTALRYCAVHVFHDSVTLNFDLSTSKFH